MTAAVSDKGKSALEQLKSRILLQNGTVLERVEGEVELDPERLHQLSLWTLPEKKPAGIIPTRQDKKGLWSWTARV
ncbi:MAG: hypothetical protein HYW07_15890 [Candidatus Latescibacteria bacterium]|nr:hypothetical protein [Candidatus Latescibacterota bacterium]